MDMDDLFRLQPAHYADIPEPGPRLALLTVEEARAIVQLLLTIDTREARHHAHELARRLPDG